VQIPLQLSAAVKSGKSRAMMIWWCRSTVNAERFSCP